MGLEERIAKLEDARTNDARQRLSREEIDALLERILQPVERSGAREEHGEQEISGEEMRERMASLREALRKRAAGL